MRRKLVVVGNGMAGMRTVEELLKIAPDLYDITVFGAEPYGNYNRIMLSPVLCGEKTIPEIMINDRDWYAQHGITLHAGPDKQVVRIDRRQRRVYAQDGTEAQYDRLLLATGSHPFIIPVPGHELEGVIAFRDIADVEAMLAKARSHSRAVVIGGGLLGLEAANGLRQQGMQVTVVHNAPVLMNRQLDATASQLLQASLEARGLRFKMAASTAAILDDGNGHCRALTFDDGEEIAADLVVMAVGIRPNVELARSCGLYCERGILVNDTLQTFDPAIYAIGECVQHRGELFGLVAPIWDQAKVCANHLASLGLGIYKHQIAATKLKVTGIDLFSAGVFEPDADCEEILLKDPKRGIYKKVVLKDNRVLGAVLYGDTKDGSWYFQLIKDQTPVDGFRDALLFSQASLPLTAANEAGAIAA